MIPKIIHQIWIGDQSKRPSNLMQTWIDKHPDWDYFLWTEKEIEDLDLINKSQFDKHPTLPGKADIARYEILHLFGGFFIDADSICINAVDSLIEKEFVCCYESEKHRGGLVANGYIGCPPKHKSMFDLINIVSNLSDNQIKDLGAWKTVGPVPFTHVIQNNYIRVLPSKSFLPVHYLDAQFSHSKMSELQKEDLEKLSKQFSQSYAHQFWGSKTDFQP